MMLNHFKDSSPCICILIMSSSCVLFVDENTHPDAHLRVTNHPPSDHLHEPLSIVLSIHLYIKNGLIMFAVCGWVDGWSIDGWSFYDDQKDDQNGSPFWIILWPPKVTMSHYKSIYPKFGHFGYSSPRIWGPMTYMRQYAQNVDVSTRAPRVSKYWPSFWCLSIHHRWPSFMIISLTITLVHRSAHH